jgi:hypothetical protein
MLYRGRALRLAAITRSAAAFFKISYVFPSLHIIRDVPWMVVVVLLSKGKTKQNQRVPGKLFEIRADVQFEQHECYSLLLSSP